MENSLIIFFKGTFPLFLQFFLSLNKIIPLKTKIFFYIKHFLLFFLQQQCLYKYQCQYLCSYKTINWRMILEAEQIAGKELPVLRHDFLTYQRVQEAAHLYTASFVQNNRLWKQMGADYDQVFSINRARMIAAVRAGWGNLMIDVKTNKICAVAISMDLVDYMNLEPIPHSSQFMKTLSKYASILEKQIFTNLLKTVKRGDVLYNFGGAIDPKYMNARISTKFWSLGITYVRLAGYKYFYGRGTSRHSSKILYNFGGKKIKTLDVQEEGIQGHYLELIEIDLSKLTFNTLSKYHEDLNQLHDDL